MIIGLFKRFFREGGREEERKKIPETQDNLWNFIRETTFKNV